MTPVSLEGKTLGKYRILEPLGRGGMAQVYRAYHPQLDRYVAIKVLRSDLMQEEEFLGRFKREAKAVAALRHPNIVQVFDFDFDVEDDLYYMVMELMEGDTLRAYLSSCRARGRQFDPGEMVRILLDVLQGLAYAHHEGIVHRDIKPANILLTRSGQAVVSDFGIAQIVGGTQYTASGALMGTFSYMSPEQGLEGRADVRSDIYSLGIVLYEMLTGRPPFDADTPLAILMKHLNDPLPLPRSIDPAIPEAFERVVLKALAKRPESRYQNATEMIEALQEAAGQAGVELPERIALADLQPLTAPPMPVGVFSGTARQGIVDAGFAQDDTDVSLEPRLPETHDAPSITSGLTFFPKLKTRGARIGATVLGTVIIMVLVNLGIVMLLGITRIPLYEYAWPVELLLVGIGLGLLTAELSSHVLLFVLMTLLGNGILLSYYSLTSNWEHWSFLWPIEPLMVIAAIIITIWAAMQGEQARRLVRVIGIALTAVAATAIPIVIGLGILRGILTVFF
ncbi:MAG: serine/threonine protein kinase [Anaerolineae bacterium]|nr:serine/threonine protein kinase [Anaerolineae bacterium]